MDSMQSGQEFEEEMLCRSSFFKKTSLYFIFKKMGIVSGKKNTSKQGLGRKIESLMTKKPPKLLSITFAWERFIGNSIWSHQSKYGKVGFPINPITAVYGGLMNLDFKK